MEFLRKTTVQGEDLFYLLAKAKKELSKSVDKIGETNKVNVRNARREGNDLVKGSA